MDSRPLFSSARTLPGKARGRSPTFARSSTGVSGASFNSPRLRNSATESAIALSRQPTDDVTRRIDQIARRPGVNGIRFPNFKVGVVDNRMLNLVAENDAADILEVFFVFELGRVDADDDQLVRILFLELLQIGNDVNAVDAAVGPEVEQHNLASQRRE